MIPIANNILPLVLCLFYFYSFSQTDVESFTRNDGLTSSTVLVTKVDSKGRVWFGTANGISVFANDTMIMIKNITNDGDYSRSIGRVNHILETTKGEIWVGSEKGLFIFHGNYWTYFNDKENDDFVVSDIFEDRRGWIWVMYEKHSSLKDVGNIGFSLIEGILQMYNGEQWHKFPAQIGGSAAITIGDPNIYFSSHIQDTKGNIWITSQDGTYCFDGQEWVEYNEEQLPSDICKQVMQSKDKTIWVAAKYGIARQVNDSWEKFEKVRGVKNNIVEELYQDKQYRIWAIITKDNRFKYLCVFNNGKWDTYTKDNVKLTGNVKQILDFNEQIIVFTKKGVSEFDGRKWTNLVDKYKIDEYQFIDCRVAKDKSIWFTGRKGVYQLTNDTFNSYYSPEGGWKPTCIFQSRSGEILVGTERKGVYIISGDNVVNLNTDDGLSDNHVKDIVQGKSNYIWIICKTGVNKYKIDL